MTTTRALIEMVVAGAEESRRRVEGVADVLRRLNGQSLQNLSNQMSGLNDRFAGLQSTLGKVTGFAIAGVSLATLGSKISGVVNSMGELDDLSQKIGTSVESLSKIQKVAKAFDVDFAGSVDPALVKLARGLTTVDDKSSKTAKALAAIGVAAKDSADRLRDPGEVMIDVVKKLQQYEDGAGKAAVVNDLFGKSGADLLPFFNDLADNVDNFSAVSGEAVAQATALQDKITGLGQRVDEVFTDITVAALPALTDLAGGFADVMKAEDGLVNTGEISAWADDLAVGLARVGDVAVLIARGIKALSNSFKVVAADVSVLQKISEVANPINAAKMVLKGRSPTEELKAVIAERNAVLETANDVWNTFWNQQGNQFEQAVLRRISQRGTGVEPQASKPGSTKTVLTYASGDGDATKAATKELNEYEALLDRINGKSVGLDPSFYDNLNKLYIGYMAGEQSLQEYVDTVETYIGQQQFVKQAEDERLKSLELYQKALDAASSGRMKAASDLQAQRDENEQIGLGKVALGELNAARLESLALRAEEKAWIADGLDISGAQAEEYRNEAAALRERAQAVRAGAQLEVNADAIKKAGEDLDKFLDPTKAQTFGDALKGAFGEVGDSMTQLISGLDAFGIRQAEVDKARNDAAVKYANDSKGLAEATAAISAKEVKSRLAGYGDMSAAAKGFFDENSAGYQVMEGAERAFRAMELASQMESLYTHLFVTSAKASGTTAGQGVETAAVMAGETARNTAKVPGVFMSFMSALGPWGMAAAGVAIAAVLGGAFSGSGVNVSAHRQETQGTGTVLGSDDKSESIANSLDAIEGATLQGLGISNGMLTSLRNIEANIGQFASLLVRTTGVTGDFGTDQAGSPSSLGGMAVQSFDLVMAGGLLTTLDKLVGGVLGSVTNAIFGGKKSVEDTGFTIDPISFLGIQNGALSSMQYADIKKDGGLFGKDKNIPALEGLGLEGNRQIANVLMSLYDTVFEAGTMLDIGADGFAAQLDGFVVDIGKISLKGLTADEIEKELSAVFSKVGDDLAAFGVGGLEQFQAVGEGYLETLTRVATNYQAVAVVTDSMGMTFSDVGLASVGARERLINLVGGLDEFTSSADQFLSDFYTDQERANSLRARITPTLDQFGIKTGAENSLQQFRSVVTGLDLTTEAGARTYATLMQIAPTFKQIADVDAAALEKRSELEIEIMELLGDKSGALAASRAIELAGLDESLRPQQQRIYALQDEAAALETANSQLETANALLDIQAQIYELTGDKAGAAAVQQQQQAAALAAMDPALRSATQELWALEAAAAGIASAKSTAADLVIGVDSAFSVLQKIASAEKDRLTEAHNLAMARLQANIAAETVALNVRKEQSSAAVASYKALSDAIASTLGQSKLAGAETVERAIAQAQLRSALAIGRAGGQLPNVDGLKDTLSVLSRDSSDMFATMRDYQRDFYRTQGDLAALGAISDAALSVEEKTLKALEAQGSALESQRDAAEQAHQSELARLDGIVSGAQEQIDVLKGIDINGLTIVQGLEAVRLAIVAANQNTLAGSAAGINDAYKDSLGRAPDAAGMDFWKDQIAGGTSTADVIDAIKNSAEAQVRKLYTDLLGRPADAGGLAYFLNSGASMSEIASAIKSSKEYKSKVPGYAKGGDHAGGWRIVGENGPELEATGAARIFNAGQTGDLMRRLSSPSEGSAALVEEVRLLRKQVERLETAAGRTADATESTASSSEQLADQFENATDGGNAMRAEVLNVVQTEVVG